ncbi:MULTISPECIES: AraC family transcriptional regulator [Hydrocarboniphaga]|uniref:HTH araC/xylS-type domain-containing protein n=2 Tax=Gammaproteobacteria TaxID=1236 RepID=I8I3E4_9GAMM|nr:MULTISPECIES: AraC family transcriptional regulator [Hydrocarboniphaga]EIT70526.1 hypothetical protein WQQ_06630 [Hydrocarboniphaga effusa AP103]MDZ4077607.1 AraC family transcriptional regulator [Hydrocarboniphaga sp.]
MNGIAAAQASTLGSWVKALQRCLDAAGFDSEPLLRSADLSVQDLDEPNLRLPIANVDRFWKRAVETTRDPLLGLRAASHITLTSSHALGFAVGASRTLREAFERIARYGAVVSDAVECEMLAQGGEYHFVIRRHDGLDLAHESIDMMVALYVRFCRSHLGREFSPLRIELRRPVPEGRVGYERILRTPLSYGRAQDRIVFDRRSLEQRLDGGNPELARLTDAIVQKMLLSVGRGCIRERVRAVLTQRLEHGEPTQKDVARMLNMCVRTLQRRLAGDGTGYKELLDATRRELALHHLRESGGNISKVTYRVGFSSSSSFTRAFRRWTGSSPTSWRAREQRDQASRG